MILYAPDARDGINSDDGSNDNNHSGEWLWQWRWYATFVMVSWGTQREGFFNTRLKRTNFHLLSNHTGDSLLYSGDAKNYVFADRREGPFQINGIIIYIF